MKVTFADFGSKLASSRLRAQIPQQELEKLGISKGKDVLVYGKHYMNFAETDGFQYRIFDVCDDHFNHPELGDYYREHVKRADRVTCNSQVMQDRIKDETGVNAFVVREPYESYERPPAIASELLWVGHASNLPDVSRLFKDLRYPLHILTNAPGFVPWTLDNMDALMSMPSIVIIPTGKSMAKSENRMVEAIRCGHYVCAEYLPSYEPFSQFFPLVDIPTHIEHALHHPEQSINRIQQAQAYIQDRYSPETIGREWLEVINGVI